MLTTKKRKGTGSARGILGTRGTLGERYRHSLVLRSRSNLSCCHRRRTGKEEEAGAGEERPRAGKGRPRHP